MSTFTCDQCWSPIHHVPFTARRQGEYAFLCTPVCLDKYEAETHRIAWTQRSLELGVRAVNGS